MPFRIDWTLCDISATPRATMKHVPAPPQRPEWAGHLDALPKFGIGINATPAFCADRFYRASGVPSLRRFEIKTLPGNSPIEYPSSAAYGPPVA